MALFSLEKRHLTVLVACLTIGTLHQIRRDHLAPQVGIWSLAAPAFVEPLEAAGLPADLIAVLRSCDELSALQRHMPDEFFRFTDELIERLEAIVRGAPDQAFRLRWVQPQGERGGEERSIQTDSEESEEAPAARLDFAQMLRAMSAPPLDQIEARLRELLAAEGYEAGPDLGASLRALRDRATTTSPDLSAAIAAWLDRG